jgi:HEAT repeat protein
MGSIQKVEANLRRRNTHGLCGNLRHRDALIRRRAAQALGELGDPSGVRCLERALRTDKDQYVRQWAIDALQAIGNATAIDVLAGVYFGGDRRLSALAGQALAALPSKQALAALLIRDALLRNEWDSIEGLSEHGPRLLSILLNSELFRSWPSAKQREVLNRAVRLGASPPLARRRELAGIGMFVSGLHTIGDVLAGLQSHAPAVRIAAAERLGAGRVRWTARPLWQRFQREIAPSGDRGAAIAIARAMIELGDERAIRFLMDRLSHADSRVAADAARMLVEVGAPAVLERLFQFVVGQTVAPARRNVPQVMAALQAGGAQVAEGLRHLIEENEPSARRLMVEVIARCGHPEATQLLSKLAHDSDPEVQRAALDALAELNSPEAVDCLAALINEAPRKWITRALAAMTIRQAVERLRMLDPSNTTLTGVVMDGRTPLARARVQVIQFHHFAETNQWGWRAISGRAETDAGGRFGLTLFSLADDQPVQLKVVTQVQPNGKGGAAFTADLVLAKGQAHEVQAKIDRLFDRLSVEIRGDRRGTLAI